MKKHSIVDVSDWDDQYIDQNTPDELPDDPYRDNESSPSSPLPQQQQQQQQQTTPPPPTAVLGRTPMEWLQSMSVGDPNANLSVTYSGGRYFGHIRARGYLDATYVWNGNIPTDVANRWVIP